MCKNAKRQRDDRFHINPIPDISQLRRFLPMMLYKYMYMACTKAEYIRNTTRKNPFNQRNCLASRHDSHQRSMMHFFCVNSKIHVLETVCIGSFRVDILHKVYCHLDTKKKEIKGSSNYCIIFIDVIKRRKVRLPSRLNMKTNSK